jgi:hypothetical protein
LFMAAVLLALCERPFTVLTVVGTTEAYESSSSSELSSSILTLLLVRVALVRCTAGVCGISTEASQSRLKSSSSFPSKNREGEEKC